MPIFLIWTLEAIFDKKMMFDRGKIGEKVIAHVLC